MSKDTKLTDASDKGIVIASVTQQNANTNIFVWIQRVSDKGFVPSIGGNYTITTANVSVFELPAGEYQFYQWSIVGGNAFAGKAIETPYRFSVKNGYATYVGNFDFTLLPDNKLQWKFTDSNANDIAEFKKRFPLIGDDRIKIDLAKQ